MARASSSHITFRTALRKILASTTTCRMADRSSSRLWNAQHVFLAVSACLGVLLFALRLSFSSSGSVAFAAALSACATHCEPSELNNGATFVCVFCPLYFFRGEYFARLPEGRANVTIAFPFTDVMCVVHDLSRAPASFDPWKSRRIGAPNALYLLQYRLGVEVYAHAIIDGLFPLFSIARHLLGTSDAATLSRSVQVLYLDLHNTVLGGKYNPWWEPLSVYPVLWRWDMDDTGAGNIFPWAAVGNHYRGTASGRGADQRLWREFAKFMALRLLGYDPPQQSGLVVVLNRRLRPDSRAILNEWDLTLALRETGFQAISTEPGTLTLAQQVLIARSAQVIIGPHGSHLANLAFVHDGVALIEVQPDGMQSPWFQGFAQAVGVRYFTGYTWNASAYALAAEANGGAGSWSAFMRSMNCNVTHIVSQLRRALDTSYRPTCTLVVSNRPICE